MKRGGQQQRYLCSRLFFLYLNLNPMVRTTAYTNILLFSFSSPTSPPTNTTGMFYPTNENSVSCIGRTTTKPKTCFLQLQYHVSGSRVVFLLSTFFLPSRWSWSETKYLSHSPPIAQRHGQHVSAKGLLKFIFTLTSLRPFDILEQRPNSFQSPTMSSYAIQTGTFTHHFSVFITLCPSSFPPNDNQLLAS